MMRTFSKVIITLLLLPCNLLAQQKQEKENQWWVGLKSGINTTQVDTEQTYAVFSYLDGDDQLKNYDLKYKKGYQIGLLGVWDFWNNFNLSIQPTYSNHRFNYENTFDWKSDNNSLQIHDIHTHSFDYIDLPILLRYEIKLPKFSSGNQKKNQRDKGKDKKLYSSNMKTKKVKSHSKTTPYIGVGYFYNRLIGAQKNIVRNETIDGLEIDPQSELIGVQSLINKANHGMIFGGGISYDIGGSFRVAADVSYQLQADQMVNQKTRFDNQKLTLKYYDVFDDQKLNHWNFSIHFLFPLKFIYSGNFKSV